MVVSVEHLQVIVDGLGVGECKTVSKTVNSEGHKWGISGRLYVAAFNCTERINLILLVCLFVLFVCFLSV